MSRKQTPIEQITLDELVVSISKTIKANERKAKAAEDDEMMRMYLGDLKHAQKALDLAMKSKKSLAIKKMLEQDTGARDVWFDSLPKKFL